jgi:hypothetical protein
MSQQIQNPSQAAKAEIGGHQNATFQAVDKRPAAVQLERLQELADQYSSGCAQRQSQAAAQNVPAFSVVQLEETLEQKIQRILGKRGIFVSDEDAATYAGLLTDNVENTPVPVKGRHRALKLNRAGGLSSVEWRPESNASKMRVSPFEGPLPEDQSSMLTMGRRPLTGGIATHDATISAAALGDIPQRSSLATVMGGSASRLSEIENSEWLHMIAHSLGGPDLPINIQAGPHSLNTAMIPFERAVRAFARAGKIVDYRVTFFSFVPEGKDVLYVHHVEIGITLPDGKSGDWTLEVPPERIDLFIDGNQLEEIKQVVGNFFGT